MTRSGSLDFDFDQTSPALFEVNWTSVVVHSDGRDFKQELKGVATGLRSTVRVSAGSGRGESCGIA